MYTHAYIFTHLYSDHQFTSYIGIPKDQVQPVSKLRSHEATAPPLGCPEEKVSKVKLWLNNTEF